MYMTLYSIYEIKFIKYIYAYVNIKLFTKIMNINQYNLQPSTIMTIISIGT